MRVATATMSEDLVVSSMIGLTPRCAARLTGQNVRGLTTRSWKSWFSSYHLPGGNVASGRHELFPFVPTHMP